MAASGGDAVWGRTEQQGFRSRVRGCLLGGAIGDALGAEGAAEMLRSGANDLGGTLMEETISRMAGSSYGSYRSIRDLIAIAEATGRPARARTTLYGEVPEERLRAATDSDGHLPELLPVLET